MRSSGAGIFIERLQTLSRSAALSAILIQRSDGAAVRATGTESG